MKPPANWTKPQIEFPAHQAQLGMTFYNGKMFPANYQGGIFVASHGSWNRTKASGGAGQLRLAEGRRHRRQERGLRRGLPRRERHLPRPAGRRGGDEGRFAADQRRLRRRHLPGHLQRAVRPRPAARPPAAFPRRARLRAAPAAYPTARPPRLAVRCAPRDRTAPDADRTAQPLRPGLRWLALALAAWPSPGPRTHATPRPAAPRRRPAPSAMARWGSRSHPMPPTSPASRRSTSPPNCGPIAAAPANTK